MEGLPEFALHWASELGSKPSNLKALHGGINNRVYLCNAKRQKWVIKGYPLTKAGQRDRMKAEVQFLRLANKVAPDLAPTLVYADQHHRCVVLEYLEGKAFGEGIPPHPDEVARAVHFIKLLNRDYQLAKEYIEMDAAEGYLTLREHIANVNQRLEAMSFDHIARLNKPMAIILTDQIRTELEQVQEDIHRLIDRGMIMDSIDPSKRCISPSDFGFHNAVLTLTGARFIDFEFAGWDDPAKTTLDFILQPRIPVLSQGSPLTKAWHPELQHSIMIRCQHLGPILRLKWACIILSALSPTRLKQLLDILTEEEASGLIRKQLDKARAYLAITRAFTLT